ncbi:hypothetical protein EYF80_035795 [Liparis tanakae]|uniref:Uncharacterized protein n=1 Tax=Liparis tanakae TaxID=230148 RepID=A0A4Z2GL85_9TELE|nr:hypothetical protein EYF80_035795 [Liparis tanakae]
MWFQAQLAQQFFTKFNHLIDSMDCVIAPRSYPAPGHDTEGEFHFRVEKSGVFHGSTVQFKSM